MMRTLLVLGVLGGITFAVVSWATGGADGLSKEKRGDPNAGPAQKAPAAKPPVADAGEKAPPPGEASVSPSSGKAEAVAIKGPIGLVDPLTIYDTRINSIKRQEVSAPRPGQILVLGTEIDPKALTREEMARLEKEEKVTKVTMGFLVTVATDADMARRVPVYRIAGDDRLWRRWTKEDQPEPNRLRIAYEEKLFLRLQKGMPIRAGQLLGLVDPALALAETEIKISKLNASDAERLSSKKTKEEYRKKYDRLINLDRRSPGTVSAEDLGTARLGWERYVEEEKAKIQSINVARAELKQAHVTLKLHELRPTASGEVRDIPKHDGEAVKDGDLIVVVQNPDLLQVEGLVPVQYAKKLALGMPVVIEPTQPAAPAGILRGHREAVNAVAVSKGQLPLVVSAGEDRVAAVWKMTPSKDPRTGKVRWSGKVIFNLNHPSAVRSVACTPPSAANNLCLTGTADGVGRLWDLDRLAKNPEPLELAEAHRGPINAVAFRGDGAVCATGSDDRSICLWDTATGKLLYRIEGAHKGAVTSLTFTPKNQLVSAGKDATIVVWSVTDGEAPKWAREIDKLGGMVDVLGVSADGTQVLYDQGRQLRVLSLTDKTNKGVITNTTGTANFTTFALFSPDGNAVLTAGSADNRLQLWRNPVTSTRARATELRQYMWPEARTNCAAFAPQAPFAVTGTRDHQVVIWNLPSTKEYEETPATAVIAHIDRFLDSGMNRVRIIAEVQSKASGLTPGGTATMVVYPK